MDEYQSLVEQIRTGHRRLPVRLLLPDEPICEFHGMKVYASDIVPEGCMIVSTKDGQRGTAAAAAEPWASVLVYNIGTETEPGSEG